MNGLICAEKELALKKKLSYIKNNYKTQNKVSKMAILQSVE